MSKLRFANIADRQLLYSAWLVALTGMVGSLYFSEIVGWVPCILCWYQRIALYPLVFILPVGILRQDRSVAFYALPLTSIGMLLAGYHSLLQLGIIPEKISPCSVTGVSCITNYGVWFGFLSIPLLSYFAFTFLTIVSIILIRRSRHDQ